MPPRVLSAMSRTVLPPALAGGLTTLVLHARQGRLFGHPRPPCVPRPRLRVAAAFGSGRAARGPDKVADGGSGGNPSGRAGADPLFPRLTCGLAQVPPVARPTNGTRPHRRPQISRIRRIPRARSGTTAGLAPGDAVPTTWAYYTEEPRTMSESRRRIPTWGPRSAGCRAGCSSSPCATATYSTGMLASWVQQAGFEPPMVTNCRDRYVAEWVRGLGHSTARPRPGLRRPPRSTASGSTASTRRSGAGRGGFGYLIVEAAGEVAGGDQAMLEAGRPGRDDRRGGHPRPRPAERPALLTARSGGHVVADDIVRRRPLRSIEAGSGVPPRHHPPGARHESALRSRDARARRGGDRRGRTTGGP